MTVTKTFWENTDELREAKLNQEMSRTIKLPKPELSVVVVFFLEFHN